ncbi:MAG: gamma-glutamyltransferase family protein [Armatimonadota bacterium]
MAHPTRPVVMGTHGAVAAGHYLAAQAGMRILQSGGNAIDAGVAMGFALAVLQPEQNGIAGEAPILVHSADRGRVFAINGHGVAPQAATIERFRAMGVDLIPGDGFLPAVVPAAVDSYITALAVFGTLPLAEVIAPALELASDGFPLYAGLCGNINSLMPMWKERYPSTFAVFGGGGQPAEEGDLLRQSDWAETMGLLVAAERRAARRGRVAALRAARDVFYKGDIAKAICDFAANTEVMDASGKPHSCLLTEQDFADYQARVEPAVSTDYRGIAVHKCGPWSQGPVFLQQLNLLEGFDLRALGHNSAEYVHTVIECAKLAFADRNAHYADPQFVEVPLDRLLSKSYADERRRLIDPNRASLEDRAGDLPSGRRLQPPAPADSWPASFTGDTTKCEAADRLGNMISITPSGGWFSASPVIPGLGFPLGTRGQMFELDPSHPNSLHPGKRPRTTLTPTLATLDGRPWLAFGSPGGDCQDQWALLFFLNHVDFGMGLQQAIDVPTFHTVHFRNSFYPRAAFPGRMVVEGRIGEEVRRALQARGHEVDVAGDWSNSNTIVVCRDADSGLLSAAATPRNVSYALTW